MIIYKFGGSSIKDANSIRNTCEIIRHSTNNLTIVVSAMGNSTDLLEEIINLHFDNQIIDHKIKELYSKHKIIIDELFEESPVKLLEQIQFLFIELETKIKTKSSESYSYIYDQVIAYGELLSSLIISFFLNSINLKNKYLDIRNIIRTDSNYMNANIDWEESQNQYKKHIKSFENNLILTQGFIASEKNGNTTSLGREGSDFTASILAYLMDAEKIIIWKDVLGILNADPDYFDETIILKSLSYDEAIELAHFGARVIHPKTIKPIQYKQIELQVRSFFHPSLKGTSINKQNITNPLVPNYIVKKNQIYIELKPRRLSYIDEHKLIKIYSLISKFNIKVNFSQNTATSFAFCFSDKTRNTSEFIEKLKSEYNIHSMKNLEIVTIRHYNSNDNYILANKKIITEQRNRETAIYLVEEIS
ncbi:MAG: aspartate kinase [Marinifilaceae bacterium]|jgi:aspartate kinase|nr:aspartate kinase [Marinifilaceae bacterium]